MWRWAPVLMVGCQQWGEGQVREGAMRRGCQEGHGTSSYVREWLPKFEFLLSLNEKWSSPNPALFSTHFLPNFQKRMHILRKEKLQNINTSWPLITAGTGDSTDSWAISPNVNEGDGCNIGVGSKVDISLLNCHQRICVSKWSSLICSWYF